MDPDALAQVDAINKLPATKTKGMDASELDYWRARALGKPVPK
jgi:hypothetical protein